MKKVMSIIDDSLKLLEESEKKQQQIELEFQKREKRLIRWALIIGVTVVTLIIMAVHVFLKDVRTLTEIDRTPDETSADTSVCQVEICCSCDRDEVLTQKVLTQSPQDLELETWCRRPKC